MGRDRNGASGEIAERVREETAERTARLSLIAAVLSLIFPVYFFFQDIFFVHDPLGAALWRIPPAVIGALMLALHLSWFRRFATALRVAYYLFLISLMAMMCGLAAAHAGYSYFGSIISGMLIIIFIVFMGSPGGAGYILPVYLMPFSALCAYLAAAGHASIDTMLSLSSPAAFIAVASVLAEFQHRLRIRELRSRISLERANAAMRRDLELARIVQEHLNPSRIPEIPGADLALVHMPLSEIGGDIYDFFRPSERNLFGIFIADVTGHGIPAALLTGMVKAMTSMAETEKLSPAGMLRFLNDRILDLKKGDFLSAVYALYDSDASSLRFARAGHPYPLLIRGEKITELRSRGALLGISRDQVFEERELPLLPDDRLILYTDGLLEALGPGQAQFGDSMEEELHRLRALPIGELVPALKERLLRFTGTRSIVDDVCIVGLQVRR
jgi:sigma-B regulation protein RsbU (phosphoserine phosphatase)